MPESLSDSVLAELCGIAGPGVTVIAIYPPYAAKTSPEHRAVFQAYAHAVHKRHSAVSIFPYMSPGATDGTALRAAGWELSPD